MCLYLCCLVFKQADDYNGDDDDGNDDSDGSGLRRSSCRGVERGADNRPVYSRKGTLWMFKVTAAEWPLTCVCVCAKCVYAFRSIAYSLQLMPRFLLDFTSPFCLSFNLTLYVHIILSQ